MTRKPENAVKKKIKEVCDELGIFHRAYVATPMTKGGFPDRLVCVPVPELNIGIFLTIEAKAHPNKPTSLQSDCMREIRDNGMGITLMVDETNVNLLKYHLLQLMHCKNSYELDVVKRLIMDSPLGWTYVPPKLVI